MNPIAFHLFGLDIRWYGVLISLGILLALFVASLRCKTYNMDFDKLTDVFLVALPCAIVGARLYYVIFNWSIYDGNILEMINIREGGLAIHGGVIGAIGAGYFMCKYKKLDFLTALDVVAPSLILGQAIGRWGNFFNMEAHGGEVSTSFISHFPSFIQKGMFIDGAYYHPTFLYESIWNLLIFILLLWLTKKVFQKGSIFYFYMLFYSIGRFFIEGLRTDSLMIGPLRVAQLISVVLLLLSILLLIKNKKKPSDHAIVELSKGSEDEV